MSRAGSEKGEKDVIVVRNVFRTFISTVCYHRKMFAETSFYTKSVGGVKVKSLLTEKDEMVQLLINWIQLGVFHALDNDYLRQMTLLLTADGTVYEQYRIKVEDPNISRLELKSSQMGKEKVALAWASIINDISAICDILPPVKPDTSIYITLKYNERVPDAYEPPLFKAFSEAGDVPATISGTQLKPSPAGLKKLKLPTRIDTGYHKMSFSMLAAFTSAARLENHRFSDGRLIERLRKVIGFQNLKNLAPSEKRVIAAGKTLWKETPEPRSKKKKRKDSAEFV